MGRTGSGKTVHAAWQLSRAPFDKQPYIIVDYKGDELLCSIDRAKEIGFNEIPKHPGLYIIHPRADQEDEVEAWLWRIWQREKVGLYFDEAYMLPRQKAFQAILTQGRSKRIPAIIVTQRPAWISRFVFSEADFYAVFHLNDMRDQKSVGEFTPNTPLWDFGQRLPDYNCRWYDVGKDYSCRLLPAPKGDAILDFIDQRLKPRRTLL